MNENDLRPDEIAVGLPAQTDAEIYCIGTIHTPWKTRRECPKRGSPDGPICPIVLDERWRQALTGLGSNKRIQVLYWMYQACRCTPSGWSAAGLSLMAFVNCCGRGSPVACHTDDRRRMYAVCRGQGTEFMSTVAQALMRGLGTP